LHSVVDNLTPKGFVPRQFCVVGSAPAIAPIASSIDPSSAAYAQLSHLVGNLEAVPAAGASVPVVASTGPICDALLKQQSWLSSPVAAPLNQHLDRGDVVLAVNAFDHDQFVHAARLLLRQADGNVLTHIFRWPP
jgi:hypothetical protein